MKYTSLPLVARAALTAFFWQKHLIWNGLGSLDSLKELVGMSVYVLRLLRKILCSQPKEEQGSVQSGDQTVQATGHAGTCSQAALDGSRVC